MRKVNPTLVITIVLGLLATELAFGALPEYEIIDLGTLGGSSSYPKGINDAGQVVGFSATADRQSHGFLWDEVNGMTDLTDLLDDSLQWDQIQSAIAINNYEQIVGRAHRKPLPDDPRYIRVMGPYFLWDSETGFVELTAFESPGLGLTGDTVRAVNDNMQVVGTTMIPRPLETPPVFPGIPVDRHASLWDSINGITDLGTLGGRNSFAYNINESGIVVGASATGLLYENDRAEAHAFLWDSDNGMIDLGTLSDNDSSAWAINNFNKVVGASAVGVLGGSPSKMTTINHAFVWTYEEGMVDIHDSSYLSSIALGINDADQVVGIVSNEMFVRHLGGGLGFIGTICPPSGCPQNQSAFLWDQRYGMIDLNDLLGEDSPWDYLESAKAINNNGQITGLGYIDGQRRGFLLNPVPPIQAELDIDHNTLNLSSKGKWITCYISLPQEYDVADVDINSILLAEQIAAAQVWVDEESQVVMVKFSRADVQDILEVGEIELIVSGELIDGARFEGKDTIKVIDKGSKEK